ncbi:MAG: FtsX-like permease family protein [Clostridia bacterium]
MNTNKTLLMDAFRTIKRSKGRFVSLIVIICLGISFFTGMAAVAPNMNDTAYDYYVDTNLMDIKLMSTTGFTDTELDVISQLAGVEEAVGDNYVDGFLWINGVKEYDMDGAPFSVKAISLDVNQAVEYDVNGVDDSTYMNRIQLIEGTWPTSSNQCLVDASMLSTPDGFDIGTTITIEASDGDLTDELTESTYTIVGIIRTPIYISYDRGYTQIGNSKLGTFVYVPSDNFLADYYTSISIKLEDSDSYEPYSDEYADFVNSYLPTIEAYTESLVANRAQELIEVYTTSIEEGEAEYIAAKAEIELELAEAEETMALVLELAANGEANLAEYKEEYNEKVEQLNAALESEENEYEAQYTEWQEKMDAYIAVEALFEQYEDAETTYNNAVTEYNVADLQVSTTLTTVTYFEELITTTNEAIASFSSTQDSAVDDILSRFEESGLVGVEVDSIMSTINSLTATGTAEEMAAYLQPQLDSLQSSLTASKTDLLESKTELEQAAIELEKAEEMVATLKEVEAQLAVAETELANAKDALEAAGYQIQIGELESMTQLSDLKYDILYYETNVAAAIEASATVEADFAAAQTEAYEGLADAEAELEQAYTDLADLTSPTIYVQDRNEAATGFEEYGDTIDRTASLATLFPWFFLIVAALMCFNTMTRMVEEERTQLGTLKALGYSDQEIVSKFVIYALVASAVGAVAGTFIGFTLIPFVIDTAYGVLYATPSILIIYRWSTAIPAVGLAILLTVATSYFACKTSLNVQTATLMRPKPPSNGKRVLFERIPAIWTRLSFMSKVTVRNVFRNKKRFFMAVAGVAGCTALTLAGFGLGDAIDDCTKLQYTVEDRINRYDLQVVLDESYDLTVETCDILTDIQDNALIGSAMLTYTKVLQSTNDIGEKTMETYFVVPAVASDMDEFVKLESVVEDGEYELGQTLVTDENGSVVEGVLITEKLSDVFSVSVGDYITIIVDDEYNYRVPIAGIVENYTFNYCYMSPEMYYSVFGVSPSYNYISANYSDSYSELSATDLTNFFLAEDGVTAVAYTEEVQDSFENIMNSIGYIVILLIVSAGMLSFIVMYNLSTININERMRELASIKVLGFNDWEVSSYIFKENTLLTIIGTAVGLVIGIFLNNAVVSIAQIDLVMYGKDINTSSFLFSILLSFVFAFLVNIALHKKLQQIDMVESLKSVE